MSRAIDMIVKYDKSMSLDVDAFGILDRSLFLQYVVAINFHTSTIVYYQPNRTVYNEVLKVIEQWKGKGYKLITVTTERDAERYAPYLNWSV